jgi:beta-xylosidase
MILRSTAQNSTNFPSRRLAVFAWAALIFGIWSAPARASSDGSVFLFSYFTDNGEDGLHLARSEDGLNWTALNGGQSFLRPEVGESRIMREPCLLLGPDGVFRLVWTDSWWGHTIGYASSRDLVHWSRQVAIPVMASEPTALNCWAPEVIYDSDRGRYLIYWATTIPGRFPATDDTGHAEPGRGSLNHRIYCTATQDFTRFTPTRLLYDGGFDAIDATLDRDGRSWLLFVKNETERPVPQKNIRLVRAPTPDGPFSAPSPPITGHFWAEGPTAIRIGGFWYVYFDKYRLHEFGVVRSRDLVHWQDVSARLRLPRGIRHGTVLRVPRALADSLP